MIFTAFMVGLLSGSVIGFIYTITLMLTSKKTRKFVEENSYEFKRVNEERAQALPFNFAEITLHIMRNNNLF